MNTVILEGSDRTVDVRSPLRTVVVDSMIREVVVSDISRTVDVSMTYTLEEFYYISPFQINKNIGEGPIYVVSNKTA